MSFTAMEATRQRGADGRPSAIAAAARASRAPQPSPHRQQAGSGGPLADWTDQLIGDAAGELRLPLTRISESIRAIASGELGQLSRLQRACLADAAAACGNIDQMITSLQRLDQHRGARQGASRCWFDLDVLRRDVEQLLSETLPHRRLRIHWHGLQAGQYQVFGDPVRAALLLAGILTSAAQRSRGSQQVMGGRQLHRGAQLLVRAAPGAGGQSVVLSVVDDPLHWEEDAAKDADLAAEGQESTGWAESTAGIVLWQQLAAALLTQLSTLRRGQGRELRFELPAAGLRSVAAQWAQWRLHHTGRLKPRKRNDAAIPLMQDADVPLHSDTATLLTVKAGAAVPLEAAERFDRRLHRDSRLFDLIYRVSPRHWVVLWDANPLQARQRIEQLASTELDSASPLRLTWSGLRTLPIRAGQTASLLADRLARESLSDGDSAAILVDQTGDAVCPLLPESSIATDRLGAELRHLAARVGAQSTLLQQQARSLRK